MRRRCRRWPGSPSSCEARSSACSGPTAPASRPPCGSSRRSRAPDSGTATVAGQDVVREPGAVRRASATCRRSGGRPRGDRPREPASCRAALQGMRGASSSRADELLELFGLGRAAERARAHVLRRDEAAPRRRDGPRAPAAGALPRRADDGPRPRGAGGDVGRARATRQRREPDDPADHALPRGGRPARRAAGDRRPGQGRRRGHARGAQARAARRCGRGRARATATAPRARELVARVAGCTRRRSTGVLARASSSGARAVPGILAALEGAGIGVDGRDGPRPSLDDVYLRYTGRDLRSRRPGENR